MTLRIFFSFALLASLSWPLAAWCDEPGTKSPPPAADEAAEAPPVDPAELIQQLEAGRFSKRQQASQKLYDAGKSAIPLLTEAAMGESRETSSRAVEILKKHYQSADESMKAAAKEALAKVAKGNNPQSARAAELALNPKKDEPPPGQPIPLRGLQFGGGQLQIQIQANGANLKRMSVQNVNGVKTIEGQDGNRKVQITDDPNNGIKVEVTETKEGKPVTSKYEAKNADDLKQKHPEAHKIYQEYSQGGAAIQIGNIQIQPGLPRGALPQIPGLEIPGMLSPEGQKRVLENIDRAQKNLDDLAQTAKKLAEKSAHPDELQKLLEQVENTRSQLEEAKSKLTPAK